MLEDPADLRYRASCERTRLLASAAHVKRGNDLKQNGQLRAALVEFLRATAIDPSNIAAEQGIQSLSEHIIPAPERADIPQLASDRADLAALAGPIQLKPISDESITLHLVEDSKIVYETVGKAAGINVLFDPEYTSKRISIDLNNTTLRRCTSHTCHCLRYILEARHPKHNLRCIRYKGKASAIGTGGGPGLLPGERDPTNRSERYPNRAPQRSGRS